MSFENEIFEVAENSVVEDASFESATSCGGCDGCDGCSHAVL
ncbi:hypothetical protein ACJJI3_09980 [Microbulbifer sp. ZKSA004]